MSGWVPMPADGWPLVTEALAHPWPEAAAVVDLRWHVDRQGERLGRGADHAAAELVRGLPGRPTLAKRWGWTDHRVRTLLASVERWWDEARWGAPWRPSPADRQPTASRPPADRQPQVGATPVITVESPADRQPVASASPAGRHTRGDPPTPAPSPTPEPSAQQTDVGPPDLHAPEPDRYDEAALYFGEIVHRAIGRRPSKGPERRSKLGQKLLREVTRDPERVLDALRYVGEGRGEKASFLRAYDGLTVETITRHVEEYAELWRAEQEPGWRPRGPPVQPRRGQSTAGDGVLEEVRRRLQAEVSSGNSGRGGSVLAGDRGGGDPPAVVDAGGHGALGAGLGGGAR